MPRATNLVASRRRRKKILKQARGYRGGHSKLLRTAQDAVDRALKYNYRDRKNNKRNFRRLWITRIGAAARVHGLNYRDLIHGLKLAAVEVDRKVLADLAVHNPAAFAELAKQAQAQLA